MINYKKSPWICTPTRRVTWSIITWCHVNQKKSNNIWKYDPLQKQTPTRLITTMSIFNNVLIHNITTTLRAVKTGGAVVSDLDQNWVDQQPLPCLSPLSLWCCSFDSELEPTISSDSSMHQGLGTTSFVIHVEKNKKTIVSHKLEV